MYDEIITHKDSKPGNEFGHRTHLITRYFVLEVLVLSICPIPYFDTYITLVSDSGPVTFLLSDFLLAFMFLRLFFLIRTCFNYSIYTDAISKKVCKSYGFNCDVKFAIKCKLLIDPEMAVSVMFICTVCIFAYLVRIFEMPLSRLSKSQEYESYFNSVWFTVVTLTTIGYGDISPGTVPGKIMTIILGFWGAIFMALLVPTVSNIFNLSPDQELALRRVRLTRQAAQAISTGVRYFRAKKDVHMLQHMIEHKHGHGHGHGGGQGAAQALQNKRQSRFLSMV